MSDKVASIGRRLIFRQLFEKESSTYTYLLGDSTTKQAILIDPVLETVDRDAKLISDLNLSLRYTVNTHCHADHITGTGKLKTLLPEAKSCISTTSGAKADILFNDGDKIKFGDRFISCIATPGHTSGCFSFLLDDSSMVFTGDALLIRGCGRTDFQGGSSDTLYDSVHKHLFEKCPDECMVYPAHDYKGHSVSLIGEEKALNPRLTKSKEEFKDLMANLNLQYPKKIDEALPANLNCGLE